MSVSKKNRFEVFKRDKFICQYCGSSAPDVILEVDHIDPVANGGTDDMFNLITSCFDCNRGKRDIVLSDNTMLQKQKKELELLAERREQLDFLLEWKKSLSNADEDMIKTILEYWNFKMSPYSINKTGEKNIKKLLKKFSVETIIDAINITKEKYIKYDKNDKITKESVEDAYNKIGGICNMKNKPEYFQRLAYLKGICRNKFDDWDNIEGAIILKDYVSFCIKDEPYSDSEMLEVINKVLIPKTIECKNLYQWKSLINDLYKIV